MAIGHRRGRYGCGSADAYGHLALLFGQVMRRKAHGRETSPTARDAERKYATNVL